MKNRDALPFSFILLLSGSFLASAQSIDLPTSKQLIEEIPGHPQRLNSLPISMAVSPDKRYVVTVNAGYGTFESKYDQSLAVLDTQTGTVVDFPDARTEARSAKQTLYSGLAFSPDGGHLYASIGSIADPTGDKQGDTGNGVIVYKFDSGKVTPERFIKLPLQQLESGRKTRLIDERDGDKAIPFPAAIAVVKQSGAERLLVAGNLSDDVLLMDSTSGQIVKRFDLSASDAVPALIRSPSRSAPDGKHAFVALWNASEIVELDLAKETVGRKLALLKPNSPTKPGSHPCAFAFSPDGKTLYVALANRDAVATVNVGAGAIQGEGLLRYATARAASYFGAEPVAACAQRDGSRLYVANMASDSVAVIGRTQGHGEARKSLAGCRPSASFPRSGCRSRWRSSERRSFTWPRTREAGPGRIKMPQAQTEEMKAQNQHSEHTYIATLLYGSLACIDEASMDKNLREWTQTVLESNRMKAADEKITFRRRRARPHQARHLHHQGESHLRSDLRRSEV